MQKKSKYIYATFLWNWIETFTVLYSEAEGERKETLGHRLILVHF